MDWRERGYESLHVWKPRTGSRYTKSTEFWILLTQRHHGLFCRRSIKHRPMLSCAEWGRKVCRQPVLPDFVTVCMATLRIPQKILHLQLLQFRDDRQEMKPRCKSMQKEEREIGFLLKEGPKSTVATQVAKLGGWVGLGSEGEFLLGAFANVFWDTKIFFYTCIPGDKMNCTVRFGNCFLRVTLMYLQPCCLVQGCQGKPGDHAKRNLQNLSSYSSCCLSA